MFRKREESLRIHQSTLTAHKNPCSFACTASKFFIPVVHTYPQSSGLLQSSNCISLTLMLKIMKRCSARCAVVVLVVFLLAVSSLSAVADVRAQTTSITNLSFPTAPVPGTSARVTFDLSYSGLTNSKTEVLAAFVLDTANPTGNSFATGTGYSTPDRCLPLGGAEFSDKAVCAWFPSSSSGTEHLTFDLEFSTHRQTYNLAAGAGVVTAAAQVIYSSLSERTFSITAGNKVQLTVNAQAAVQVTIDDTTISATSSLDVDVGTHSISVPLIVPIDNLTQLKFDHWEDGSNLSTRSVDVESDTTLSATYITQHKLLLTSTINATGEGWYDDGSTARFSVPPSAPIEGVLGVLGGKLQFKGWYENGKLITAANAGTIQMNDAHSLGARWQADYTFPIGIIGGIIAAICVAAIFSLRRTKSDRRRK